MYNNKTIQNLKIVPEEIIIDCAKDLEHVENNNFKKLLKEAEQYKMLDLTPIFISTPDMKNIFITSLEKMQKKYN